MARSRVDLAAVRERFPSVDKVDWVEAFRQDSSIFTRLLRDILKADQAEAGRPGPRPKLDQARARRRLRQLFGDDYSILSFAEAARILAHTMSVRELATATGLNRNTVHRLLAGALEPDAYEMQQFAKVFDKQPSYFLEYRILVVLQTLEQLMIQNPEASMAAYQRVRKVKV